MSEAARMYDLSGAEVEAYEGSQRHLQLVLGSASLRREGPLAWQEDALCLQTDPEAFFVDKGGSTRPAKEVCAGCEVRPECLQYALDNNETFGVWGGLSERERRALKKKLRNA